MGGLPVPTQVLYWTYAKLAAGTVIAPVGTRALRKEAQARSASGSPLRYAPERWHLSRAMLTKADSRDSEKRSSKEGSKSPPPGSWLRGMDTQHSSRTAIISADA